MKIEKGKLYVYVGEGEGKGEIHELIHKSAECITTAKTYSFRGTTEEFVDNFHELEEQGV